MFRAAASLALLPTVLVLSLGASGSAQVDFYSFSGPTGEEWSRMGTDGTDLYFTTNGVELHRYSFVPGSPAGGTWTRMADAPRTIDAWDSYRGLAHQGGFLYTSALPQAGGGRTIVRYDIALNAWAVWRSSTGSDLTISSTSGNGMFMDPVKPGVGYSAWHAGNHWVRFDWTAKTANNSWMTTGNLFGVPNDDWVCRCDDAAYDGAGTYYATKADWVGGASAGDVVFSFDINGSAGLITLLGQKPFQTGAGSSLEFIPTGHVLNKTGHDELWMFRGSDGLVAPHEGWGSAGTTDLGVLDLTTLAWTTYTTPFYQGRGSDSVLIGDLLFAKSCGNSLSPTAYDSLFYVTKQLWRNYGDGVPGTNGVPSLTLGGQPVIGTQPNLMVGSSSSQPETNLLIVGFAKTVTPGFWGGNLYVVPAVSVTLGISAVGHTLPLPIPNSPALVGFSAFFQSLQSDPGAAAGVASSRGLEMTIGL